MESPILKQIAKFLQDKKKYKRWLAVFVCLAVVVGFATTAALKMRGKAMTHDERVLNCKLQVHQHAETCYDQEKNIICGYADYVVHKHNDDCYDPHNGNLVCALPEVEAHQHTDECYQEQQALACGLEESEGHQHTEECRTKEQGELTCQAEEHTHTEECQAEDGAFSCGKEEHTHADECYQWTETLTCGQEESEGHHHTEACNQVQKTLVCQRPEIEVHTHGDECYQRVLITPEGEEIVQDPKDNTGVAQEVLAGTANKEVPEGRIEVRRSCGKLQAEEHTHTQENGCIEIREVLDGSDLRPVEETAAEGNTENGNENLENVQTNWNGLEKSELGGAVEEQTIVKTFEGDRFKVIAEYKKDANIPEEAEFLAEEITAESDEEHFAEREAELQEQMGDEEASMRALLKVGFYVDGEEIEPASPVTITVQFLDEEGLPEGAPIAVVHFAEKGAEKLEGSDAEDDSTTFEMNSFSEVGFCVDKARSGDILKDGSVFLDEKYEYEGKLYNVIFRFEGKGKLVSEESDVENADSSEIEGDTQKAGTSGKNESADTGKDLDGNADTEVPDDTLSPDEEEIISDENEDADTGNNLDGNVDSEASESEVGSYTEEGEEGSGEGFGNDNSEFSNEIEEDEENQGGSTVTIPGDDSQNVQEGKVEIEVKALGKKNDAYQAVISYAKEQEEIGELEDVQAMQYTLTYHDGRKLDVSDCNISAQIISKENIVEEIRNLSDEEDSVKGSLKAFEVSEDTGSVKELDISSDSQNEAMEVQPKDDIMVVGNRVAQLFTVQYYAYVDVMQTTKVEEKNREKNIQTIKMIDTSNQGNGTGGNLPTNTWVLPLTYIKAQKSNDVTDGKNWPIFDVLYDKTLMEIFTEKTYDFGEYPNLTNVNKFAATNPEDKLNYDLYQIWVLKKGGNSKDDTGNLNNWLIYENTPPNGNDGKIHTDFNILDFTNNPEAYKKDPNNKILIQSDSVIRIVGKSNVGGYNNDVAFFDYNITDGKVYSDEKCEKETERSSAGTLYAKTNRQGINSVENYSTSSKLPLFGFGNNNTGGTGVQNEQINGFYFNQGNSDAYGKCYFGLVESELENGYPVYKANAPDLFSLKPITGKEIVSGYSLDFNRNGDTYTLSSVKGSNTKNLERFQYGGKGWTATGTPEERFIYLWQNQFWPMDSSEQTYGTDGNDLKFGDSEKTQERKAVGASTATFPVSDDGKDHNSYFGMSFSVKFNLSEDYVGPLNYYFFGDDDMWVFLDGKLICDIGGVHQAAGEYVDLWDWVEKGEKGKGEHELKFFYTERGASGSTCWMQFTLPSISAVPITYPNGQCQNTLKIGKTVNGTTTDEAFEFEIEFLDKDGKVELINYYAYEIQEGEGENTNIVESNNIKTGDTFKLKANQTIVIRNLPDGTKYTIKEKKYTNYTPQVNGVIEADGTVSGTIDWTKPDIENYINMYSYELPKTGGIGTTPYTIAGILLILFGSAGFMYRKKFREGRVGGSS